MNTSRGFTLIELAIVIVIAGILAAVAIPVYQGFVDAAKWSEAESALGAIKTATATYISRYGSNKFTSALNIVGSSDGSEFARLGFDIDSFRGMAAWHGQAFELRITSASEYSISATSSLLTDPRARPPNESGAITIVVTATGTTWKRFGSAQ